MVQSAAFMFGGATFVGLVEVLLPGGQDFSMAPTLAALVFVVLLLKFGRRLPTGAMIVLGPIGAAMIGLALATTPGGGDAAILYVWPVLWEAYFFGRRGTILIIAWIGVVHAAVLLSLPAAMASMDRWLDVMVSIIVVGAVVEVLARRNEELLAQLTGEARMDRLTGIFNRRGFDERAAIELARARREKASLAIIAFDLDYFKAVNDNFGHAAGDRVLARLGMLLKAEARDSDVVARIGGEEFVALLPRADAGDAHSFAERIRTSLASDDDPTAPSVTVSAGAVSALAPGQVEPLLRSADIALYKAKLEGRNRTVVEAEGVPV
jgi:diguanylate cyclase (GGDEF)-like protein